jgi:UDP-N-acetylglucosamine--N-acetylmuramyl-(pentapeptide) pyrophosphoryl-undecaprenol N-acetylglucosamine transferase
LSDPKKKKRVVAFAGGGSGGHLYPQIAIAEEFRRRFPEDEVFFVTTRGTVDEKVIPRHGFPVEFIPSGKLNGQSPLRIVLTFFSLLMAVFQCLRILRSRKPDLVFSAGGYAGAPFLFISAILGYRAEILEQNRIPGLANRWMAKVCKRVYVNFPGTAEDIPEKEVIVVGHPCRAEIEGARWGTSEAEALWAGNPFRVFVFGGSQGAMGINRLMTAAAPFLRDLPIEIHHQTGERDFERTKQEYAEAQFKSVRVVSYIHNMASSYREAHLVICRAGASSLAELAAAGKASFLIPLVSRDRHQEFNAEEMKKLRVALTELQGSLTGRSLADRLIHFFHHRQELVSLSEKIVSLHRPDAAQVIAQELGEGRNGK